MAVVDLPTLTAAEGAPAPPDARELVSRLLASEDPGEQARLVASLGDMGGEAVPAVPVLLERARWGTEGALAALHRIVGSGSQDLWQVVPLLEKQLLSPRDAVRVIAADLLGRITRQTLIGEGRRSHLAAETARLLPILVEWARRVPPNERPPASELEAFLAEHVSLVPRERRRRRHKPVPRRKRAPKRERTSVSDAPVVPAAPVVIASDDEGGLARRAAPVRRAQAAFDHQLARGDALASVVGLRMRSSRTLAVAKARLRGVPGLQAETSRVLDTAHPPPPTARALPAPAPPTWTDRVLPEPAPLQAAGAESPDALARALQLPVGRLGLSRRATFSLREAGVTTLEDLVSLDEDHLLVIKGIDEAVLLELKRAAAGHGLELGVEAAEQVREARRGAFYVRPLPLTLHSMDAPSLARLDRLVSRARRSLVTPELEKKYRARPIAELDLDEHASGWAAGLGETIGELIDAAATMELDPLTDAALIHEVGAALDEMGLRLSLPNLTDEQVDAIVHPDDEDAVDPDAPPPQLLGEMMLRLTLIEPWQRDTALAYQREAGVRVGRAMVELGYVNEVQMTRVLARQFDLPFVDLTEEVAPDVIDALPAQLAQEHRVVPVGRRGQRLVVAFDDRPDPLVLDNLRFMLGCPIEAVLATCSALEDALVRYYGSEPVVDLYDQVTLGDIEFEAAREVPETAEPPRGASMSMRLMQRFEPEAAEPEPLSPDEAIAMFGGGGAPVAELAEEAAAADGAEWLDFDDELSEALPADEPRGPITGRRASAIGAPRHYEGTPKKKKKRGGAARRSAERRKAAEPYAGDALVGAPRRARMAGSDEPLPPAPAAAAPPIERARTKPRRERSGAVGAPSGDARREDDRLQEPAGWAAPEQQKDARRDAQKARPKRPKLKELARKRVDVEQLELRLESSEVDASTLAARRRPPGRLGVARLTETPGEAVEGVAAMAHAAPVMKLLNLVLLQSLKDRARSVTLETDGDEFTIVEDVDGEAVAMMPPPAHLAPALTSRIKTMAGIDPEASGPQFGEVALTIGDRPVLLDVHTTPTATGERCVVEIVRAERYEEAPTDTPAGGLMRLILRAAVDRDATALRLRPVIGDRYVLGFTIDGRLREQKSPTKEAGHELVRRLKALAGANVDLDDITQLANVETVVDGKRVLLELTVNPTARGEELLVGISHRIVDALDEAIAEAHDRQATARIEGPRMRREPRQAQPLPERELVPGEGALSEEAGKPGPLERFVAATLPLVLLLNKAVGLAAIPLIHAADIALQAITGFVGAFWRALRTLAAAQRTAARRAGGAEAEIAALIDELATVRFQCARLLRLPGPPPGNDPLCDDEPGRTSEETTGLQLALDLRNRAARMEQDAAMLTRAQATTAAARATVDLFSNLSATLGGVFRGMADLTLLSRLRYSRHQVEEVVIDLVAAQRQLIRIYHCRDDERLSPPGHRHWALTPRETELLGRHDLAYDHTEPGELGDLDAWIATSRARLRRLLRMLVYAERVVDPTKWSRVDVLREAGREDASPLVRVEAERWLRARIAVVLGAHATPAADEVQRRHDEQRLLDRRQELARTLHDMYV